MSTPTSQEQNILAAGRAFPWHEVYVKDEQAAVDFYGRAFDMGTHDYDMGEMGTYKMLTVNGTPVAGIFGLDKLERKDIPPHWAVYLAVDNVDARLAKVRDLGGTVVVEPLDIPEVGRMALIADPQGAHIWLFTPSPM